MKKISTMIIAALILAGSILPAALAQGVTRGHFYSKGDVERIIKRVEDHSDTFKNVVDKYLDRSYLDGTRKEDNINEQVKQLEKAIDVMRDKFDRSDRWWETRSHVVDVLRQADDVNRIMHNNHFNFKIHAEWASLRYDLNTLAGVYELPKLK